MTIYYCSNEATNGYSVGSDTPVDATSKLTPYLTANAALDFIALSAQDGDTLIFNDGIYTYTNNDGRYALNHEITIIEFENDFLTTLVFSGTNIQGLIFEGSDVETRDITVGKGIITTENSAKFIQVTLSAHSLTNLRFTVNWFARVDPDPLGSTGTTFGLFQACSNVELNILDGGSSGVASGDYFSISQSSDLIIQQVDIAISKWVFDLECSIVGGTGVIEINYLNDNSSGSVSVSGVTGNLTDVDTDTTASYAVHLRNCPDGATIENCNDLTYTTTSANKLLSPWVIDAPIAGGITCDSPIIRNNKRCLLTTVGGFHALIGGEGSDHNTPNGLIDGNTSTLTNLSGSTSLHGICHIGCVDGVRQNNIIDGAAIGSLTKRGTAISQNNTYRNIGGDSDVYLFGKAAENGTQFLNETCYISTDFSGHVEQALEDGDGTPQDSVNTVFSDTRVLKEGAGDLNALAELFFMGSLVDTSTATSTNMAIDDNLTLPTAVVNISGVPLATLALANGEVEVTNMHQESFGGLSLTGPLTGPLTSSLTSTLTG